jgi:hypothetical protein
MTAQFIIPPIEQRLGEPDHEFGYTREALMDRLMAFEWRKFVEWIDGQTMALNEKTGGPVFFTWDVKRFFEIVPGKKVFD